LKRVVFFGAIGGALIALLRLVEYQHFVRAFPSEAYGGLIAVFFAAAGIYLGVKWARPREVVVVKEVRVRETGPFVLDAARLAELGLTPRELEVLQLIAQGLSNREIGEKLFVADGTVKTHSSRIFQKLGVERRVQAVSRARELGLVP